jgi:hypothetical protein|tara:strand:+ start:334 stop:444 length:111 start_codon:yes stop_codon:yes gene_type:complete
MDNFKIWQRAQGRAAMLGFWAIIAVYAFTGTPYGIV